MYAHRGTPPVDPFASFAVPPPVKTLLFCFLGLFWDDRSKTAGSTRTGRLSDVTGHITGQGLDYLYQAPCADSLVCLGLRNQPAIGRPDLRALGSRVRTVSSMKTKQESHQRRGGRGSAVRRVLLSER